MSALLRSELRKYFSTRMWWGMSLAMFLVGGIFAAITGAFSLHGQMPVGDAMVNLDEVVPELTLARMIYAAGIQFGSMLALVIGVLSMGQEFRHKTISNTFLAGPRRHQVIIAKVGALVVILALNAVAHIAGAVVGGGILLSTAGVALVPDAGALAQTFALIVLILIVWGLVGLGLGVVIPNQVAALFIGIAFTLILEPLLAFGLTFFDGWDVLAKFFPSQAATATLSLFSGVDSSLAEAMGGGSNQLPWWGGALTLVGYALVMTLIGLVLTRRRDIA
ncbi:ABC transporter permease [Ornithinimicrobium cryptoxanthini]|uniref:ABC transporter permease n=1 Tax=Ornithinimicrobium cryptoxanthini TaxID=2934161 RepID=A0ABY4YG18_9MICO|nr:ABC transporter permease subunit [Ornithinimicrobium cryptoxanthini]USQ75718.1 ABC transporter permease [Ornithinimicrobium cryptoxanthini]